METHVMGRLADVLKRHKARLGSWTRLADAIDEVNDGDPHRRIDRRTLERLCGDQGLGVQLKLSQALALDHWFGVSNEGSLLAKQLCLIDSVRESYNVNFLVAAKYLDEMRTDVVSRWDLRAITRLLRTRLNRMHVSIWDITGPDNWREHDTRIINAANISIGSPVANYASEVLMRKMIGMAPGESSALSAMPFFIVGSERDSGLESAFVTMRPEALLTAPRAGMPLDGDKRALVVNKIWYVSSEDLDYALLLAQRNPKTGQAQMVLCGLTGQGTYQLARILQAGQPPETLPALRAGQQHPPIFAAVYRLALVPDEEVHAHSQRRVIGYAAVDSPTFIHHLDGEWQFLG